MNANDQIQQGLELATVASHLKDAIEGLTRFAQKAAIVAPAGDLAPIYLARFHIGEAAAQLANHTSGPIQTEPAPTIEDHIGQAKQLAIDEGRLPSPSPTSAEGTAETQPTLSTQS